MGNGLWVRRHDGGCIGGLVGAEGGHIEWPRRRRIQRVGGHRVGRVGGHQIGEVYGLRLDRIGGHRVERVAGHGIRRVGQVPGCPETGPFEICPSIVVNGVLHHEPEHFDGIGQFDLALLDFAQPLEDLVPELGGRPGQ